MTDIAIAPILVAACGNPSAGDDRFGHEVVCALRADAPEGTEVVDLGTNPCSLIDLVAGRRLVVVIDAAAAPDVAPGRLLVVDWDSPRRPPLDSARVMGTHGLSIAGQIELARQLGMLTAPVWLVAASIEVVGMGKPIACPPSPKGKGAGPLSPRERVRVRGGMPEAGLREEGLSNAHPHPDPLPAGEGEEDPHPSPLPQAGEGEESAHPSPLSRHVGREGERREAIPSQPLSSAVAALVAPAAEAVRRLAREFLHA